MSTALHWTALALYLVATAVYLAFVISQRRGFFRMGRAVLWVGWAVHTVAIAAAWVEAGVLPAVSLRQSLDLFSWALVGAALLLNLRLQIMVLGALAAPLGVVAMLAASVLPAAAPNPAPMFKSIWLVVHVATVMGGYGLLAVTFLGALLYLLLDWRIRAKKLGPLFKRLPSLTLVDSLNHRALLAGFTLMTVGMITGAVYAQLVLGSYWRWDPKEVWALITWLLYAALLHTRLVAGWRGRRGSWLAIAAFGVLMFTFVGAGLLLPGYHSFEAFTAMGGSRP